MQNTDFTFYSKAGYYQDLGERIDQTKAGDTVALATMAFEPKEHGVSVLMEKLYAAAERGVRVSLSVDAYIFLVGRSKTPGPLLVNKEMPKHMSTPFRAKLAALQRLEDLGGRYAITNQPHKAFTNPFAGRSHIKFAIINDRLYVGGCNLTTAHNIDLMVGWNDKKSADWLYRLSESMVHNNSTVSAMQYEDQLFALDKDTELLVDSGKRKQSIIFDHALELIDQAKESILITCQYFPNDVTTQHLLAAHKRGVAVNVVYNHPGKHVPPHNVLHQLVVWRERMRTPKALFAGQLSKDHHFIHSKLIATEQGAIVGSHNYVSAGVNFGTAEIALLRRDPAFSASAIAAIELALQNGKIRH